ncbi:MAG: ABC-F type ribosomal protection protein [Ruminococcus sp.]|jgi:lincosamide and streptogramin A transport system ATP-binding/permease protein|nr:ABC-F type ribosomal protection protein [Ruminococcus sp.]
MSIISINNLTFSYDGSFDNIFENLSLTLDSDWKLGLVGRNGRGKTTLLKILSGELDGKNAVSSPGMTFSYFPPKTENESAITLDVIKKLAPGAEEWEILREIGLLSVSDDVLYRPFSELSGGERSKVMLAALFTGDGAHFLLIDEPTNHLDETGRATVSRYLSGKKGFILVSHDRAFLDGCIDHIMYILPAGIEITKGNFSVWEQNKAYRDAAELAENERLKKDIKRLETSAKRASDWSDKTEKSKKGAADKGFIGHKSAKMMSKAKNIEDRKNAALAEKVGLLKNLETAESLKLSPLLFRGEIAYLKNAEKHYGEKTLFENLSFGIKSGDRIAVTGGNGAGKSTLLKLFSGETTLSGGEIYIQKGTVISYVSQETEYLSGSLNDFAGANGLDRTLFFAILRKLGFERVQFEKNIDDFSAGQRKKTLIAKSLCESAHIYIWDEPLNFIDLFSRKQIENLITEFAPTLLFVEHDRVFREKIATREITLAF